MTSQKSMGSKYNELSKPRNEVDSAFQDEIRRLQACLFRLSVLISSHSLPSETGIAVARELGDLSQECNERLAVLQSEHIKLGHRLQEKHRLLENAINERDRACQEIDAIRVKYDGLLRQKKNLQQAVNSIEKEANDEIDELRSEIRFKDDQLQAKRSIWVEKQKSSSSKYPEVGACDPFTTPTNQSPANRLGIRASRSNPSKNLTVKFRTLQTVSSPFKPVANETAAAASKAIQYPTSQKINETLLAQEQLKIENTTSLHSLSTDQNSQALIPFKTIDKLAVEFSEMISKLYGLIEGWSHTYGNHVNPLDIDQRISNNEENWKLMIECVRADRQDMKDSEQHLVFLLREPSTRAWLIFRIIFQYIEKDIWTGLAFLDFNEDCDERLRYVVARMKEKGLTLPERASLVSAQTIAISHIVSSEGYPSFRNAVLDKHTKNLRALLGPMLNLGVARANAGRDLGAIVVNAFDISTKLFTSSYSFVIMFPKCGDKFQYASMICRDSSHSIDPLSLQIKQYRLKLVITPIITLRDDRQLTIKVASVQYANVLVMV